MIVAQQSLFDPTRAPAGKHTAWAYCHVPHGSTYDMTARLEAQIERFAPGFRDRILARHVMTPAAFEQYNANYIGGDINGGVQDLRQLFTRPTLRWYRTPRQSRGCISARPRRRPVGACTACVGTLRLVPLCAALSVVSALFDIISSYAWKSDIWR